MKKVYISGLIFISLFCLASFALADVTINNPLNSGNFSELLTKIANGVGGLIAMLSTIMFIVAGILYLTSAGSPERITTAKKALIAAIIGIVIGIAAWSIAEIIKGIIGVV